MSSTLLEVTRSSHEDVERLERLTVKELQREPTSGRDRLFQNHRVRTMVDNIISTTHKLVEIYEDKDNARKDEIAALGGQTAAGGTNVFSAFYDRLKEIREYHRRHPSARVFDVTEEFEEMLKEEPVVEFSGEVETEFEELWADGKILGWQTKGLENANISSQDSLLDLDYYSTVEELIEVGPAKLKEALAARGLKTGGTIVQRAERLFLTKHVPLDQLDKKHFVKGARASEQSGGAAVQQKLNSMKEISLMEAKLQRMCELLRETIEQTKNNVEKKQALTYEEMEAEREEEEIQADSESDDEDQQIYNPLKLPMGWDGKPIPYWLYKLHGLGQEFKCEICGNHSYWGRRAFERHFKEWRHQHGMRCLNIPNTKNFNEITSIQEAKDLWGRIQERQGLHKWRPDLEEEYEDKEGNIYNKKTYTDLQRQGLI